MISIQTNMAKTIEETVVVPLFQSTTFPFREMIREKIEYNIWWRVRSPHLYVLAEFEDEASE